MIDRRFHIPAIGADVLFHLPGAGHVGDGREPVPGGGRLSTTRPVVCDHCDEPVHRDCSGWWVGGDETADCRTNLTGHEVEGEPR